MSRPRSPGSRPDPILRAHLGKQTCSTWTGADGNPLKLCVRGNKYGFVAELKGRTGGSLPVPTGDARTPAQAIKNAKQFLDRTITRRN